MKSLCKAFLLFPMLAFVLIGALFCICKIGFVAGFILMEDFTEQKDEQR